MIGDARTPDEAVRERKLRELTDNGEIISAADYKQRSRRAFLTFAGVGVVGFAGFKALQSSGSRDGDNIPSLLRNGLEFNQSVWQTLERDGVTARTFSVSDREEIRINGRHGLQDSGDDLIQISDAEAASWEIAMTDVDGSALDPIPLAVIKSDFEVQNIVWEHKCVEGWANIVHWTGVRVSDVLERYAPDQLNNANWGVMRTPASTDEGEQEREYSAAIDRYTLNHSQSLFAWQLNGEELTAGHGSPVRFVTPMKYGIKQIKRVGIIDFANERPTDYWTTRGYDLHAGF